MGEHRAENERQGAGWVATRVRRALRRIRRWLGDSPVFLPIVLRCTPLGTSRRLRATTTVVVEGFPRSGNTFAAFALRHVLAGQPDVHVASHVHTPSQVKRAIALGLPTLVVIRQPDDAVASLLIAAPHVSQSSALTEWIHHYEVLAPLQDKFVVASFSEVIEDMPSVIARVNRRFGAVLPEDRWSANANHPVLHAMEESHLRVHQGRAHLAPWPHEQRSGMRASHHPRADDAEVAALRRRAEALFHRYIAFSTTRSRA